MLQNFHQDKKSDVFCLSACVCCPRLMSGLTLLSRLSWGLFLLFTSSPRTSIFWSQTNKQEKILLQLHLHHCQILDFFGTSSYYGSVRMHYMFTKCEKYFITCLTPGLSVSWIHGRVHLKMAQSTPLLSQSLPRYRESPPG